MGELGERKQKIVEAHQDRVDKVQSDILEHMTKSLIDKKSGGGGEIDLGLFKALKAKLDINKETSLGMDSADRLEYSKVAFDYLKYYIGTIQNDPGYQSVLKDIDEQMERYRKELDQIEEELKIAQEEEDKELERRLIEARRGIMQAKSG